LQIYPRQPVPDNSHGDDSVFQADTAKPVELGRAGSHAYLSDDELDMVVDHSHYVGDLEGLGIGFFGQRPLHLQEPDDMPLSEPYAYEDDQAFSPLGGVSLIAGEEADGELAGDDLEVPWDSPRERLDLSGPPGCDGRDTYFTFLHGPLLGSPPTGMTDSGAGNEDEEARQMRNFWYRFKP
jgi:hypothetical protein